MIAICFHDWTEWSKLITTYSGVWQFRACKKCNKIRKRWFSGNNDVNLLVYNSEIADASTPSLSAMLLENTL